jgi:hypothetical protein
MKVLTRDAVWPTITELANSARAGSRRVAVPYVGSDALERLHLGRGDRLVADCRPATARSGSTSPAALRSYLDAGVDVRRWEWLHAKVFVFGDVAVVGSANATWNSEHNLDEAAIVLTAKRDVADARAFVEELCSDAPVVDDDWLDQCEAAWLPPRDRRPPNPRDGWIPIPEGDDWTLWIVRISSWDAPAYVMEAIDRHRRSVRAHQSGPFSVESFSWDSRPPFKAGDVIVEVFTSDSGRTTICVPALVEAAWKVSRGRNSHQLVTMLRPRGHRPVSLRQLNEATEAVGWKLRQQDAQRATTLERRDAVLNLWGDLRA